MRKPLLVVAIYVLVASLIFSSGCLDIGKKERGNNIVTSAATPLKKFSSYEELKSFVKSNMGNFNVGNYSWRYSEDSIIFAGGNAESVPEHSTTNVQVEGVDEADIVKTDGEYIYVVSGSNVVILKAYPPGEAQILSQISLNITPIQLFLNGNKLAVLGNTYRYTHRTSTIIDDRTFVKVYDVSNRSSPVLARNFSLTGNYVNARMIGDYIYVVITQPVYLVYDTLILPKIYSPYGAKEISATEIYYANNSDESYTFTTVVSINIQNEEQEETHETFLQGMTSCMYVSMNNIYLTTSNRKISKEGLEVTNTDIHRISIAEGVIEYEVSGEVSGTVLNQFSMDEYNGYFRITTTINGWETTSKNCIYLLGMNMSIIGKLENIAPGERIYSARFVGGRCYLVTFRQVDPFFVVDLEDPSSPKVLGELKIPGYSGYLHHYDENHVIGIGKEGSNVKLSFFDVTNVSNPKETDKYIVSGEWSDTPVLNDHKAFLVDGSKGVLVLPVNIWSYTDMCYRYWQGAYVFTLSSEGGLVLKGMVTHIENYTVAGRYFYTGYSIKRTLYIDNVLYTISDKKIKMNSLDNLDALNELELSYSGDYVWYWY